MMKYRLNKLPVKTTNNFKINDLEIELDIPKINILSEYVITDNKDIIINKKIVNKKLTTKIGLEFDKYLDVEITIPKNKIITDTVCINYNFSKDEVLISKITINYEENSSCNFVINYNSSDDNSHFNHLYEVVKMGNGSNGNITILNNMNDNSYNFMGIETSNNDLSNLTYNIIDLTGMVRVYNVFSDLKYDDLDVKNGTEALVTYAMFKDMNKEELEFKYKSLLEYCKQDTWAMVVILNKIREIVKDE